jgi:hypothetical protein
MAKKASSKKKSDEMVVEAVFEKDTKRKARFKVGDYSEPISGTIYFDKEKVKNMPKRIIIEIVEDDTDD